MSYADEVLADGPLIYWRLGEPSGTTAADDSGNSHTGTYTNGPTLGVTGLLTGDTDMAISLDAGSDQYVVQDGTYSPGSLAGLSAECVIQPTELALENGPWLWGFYGGGGFVELSINASGKPRFTAADAGQDNLTAPSALVAGEKYHLVGVFDSTDVLLYVNGVLVATAAQAGPLVFSPGKSFYAGSDIGDPFDGILDECAYYETALSAARVSAHYDAMVAAGGNLYTPPIVFDMGPINPDTEGLQKALFRHYSPHGRYLTVWKLATDPITYSLEQPWPLVSEKDEREGNLPIGNATEVTYLHVYQVPETVSDAEAARLIASGIGTVT